MSGTIRENDMLKTAVPERGMAVTTYLRPGHRLGDGARGTRTGQDNPPWTVVWQGTGPATRMVWLHFWQGRTTPGGLGEAHAHIVGQVRRGEIPAQGQAQEAEEERCASTLPDR